VDPSRLTPDARGAAASEASNSSPTGLEPTALPPNSTGDRAVVGMVGVPRIAGYDIVRELQHGSQGVVFEAVHRSMKRRVAIKLLLEGVYASENARRRFQREIELAARLKHPHVVTVFDSGISPDGHPYCVMDFVDGLTLREHVRERCSDLESALALVATICEAVHAAHQRGIIHRDLKSSNVLVDVDGTPRVLDFGLAKELAAGEEGLTMTGQIFGTPAYMSPEQADGRLDEVDVRTDVYALGIILYELLTGTYPYPVTGSLTEVIRSITTAEPLPLARSRRSDAPIRIAPRGRANRLDEDLQTIVAKALAKEPDRRYQSAGELARDLRHYLAGELIEACRDSAFYMLRKNARRYRVHLTIGGLALAIAAIGLGYQRADQRRVEAEDMTRTLALYSSMFANTSVPLLTFTASDGRFIDANEAASRLLGYSRDEFQRMTVYELSGEPEKTRSTMARQASGEITRIPHRLFRRKDGTLVAVEITVGRFDWQGQRIMVGILREGGASLQPPAPPPTLPPAAAPATDPAR